MRTPVPRCGRCAGQYINPRLSRAAKGDPASSWSRPTIGRKPSYSSTANRNRWELTPSPARHEETEGVLRVQQVEALPLVWRQTAQQEAGVTRLVLVEQLDEQPHTMLH